MAARKERIGVVGAGLMGAEIALVHALAGHNVILCDRTEEALSRAQQRLNDIYDKGVSRSFYDTDLKAAVLGAIQTTVDFRKLSDRELVIEAVFEQSSVKEEVQGHRCDLRPDCNFATNTSTMPIGVLASFVAPARRSRFIGTHYFSPVSHEIG
ncbi:3-hydroxyacyl-CoA dehydrogenase family protein [Bradyrhizobium sp. USDA 3315]